MNKNLQELIKISLLDKEIDLMDPKIAQVRKGLTEREEQKAKKELLITDLNEEKKEHLTLLAKCEETLKNASTKLNDIASKMQEVKTEKELKALNIEEEIAKEQITFQNAEIQRIEKLIQSTEEKIQSTQQEIQDLEDQMKKIESEIALEIENIRKEQTEISKKKSAIVEKLDQKVVVFYEKVRKWAKSTSVVPVYKQACGGCFIRLNDRAYSELLKGDSVSTCPHCGRILFVEES
ncbi:zinc ribbon domain-containing protein [Helicobacter kayseriensis]|uniref:zinc ribbon domain-containing protein n=1 Tax=Helicobacter kayseriensis TaxID=2905877 RepID=UPI001E2E57DD|nr:C4-type zinc ribbon domain-containing protein [Helicobacter kayseriensis]MCE3047106.1 C4-type zinc ribbon domain-containing protein [Helicobacter kayseriensis]MCE3048234.1 C4-type zinc ribbon domain-containing protein [Helicobacter kayseriensis]